MLVPRFDVVCPHCCGVFHETTEFFRENTAANGSMFRAKPQVVEQGWEVFPPYDTTEYADLACPACGQPYVDSTGRVIRLVMTGDIEVQTEQERIAAEMDALVAEYREGYRPALAGPLYAEVEPPPLPKKRGRRRKIDA